MVRLVSAAHVAPLWSAAVSSGAALGGSHQERHSVKELLFVHRTLTKGKGCTAQPGTLPIAELHVDLQKVPVLLMQLALHRVRQGLRFPPIMAGVWGGRVAEEVWRHMGWQTMAAVFIVYNCCCFLSDFL